MGKTFGLLSGRLLSFVVFLSVGAWANGALAGPVELEALLRSPAGRAILDDLGIAAGSRLTGSAAELARAEEGLLRIRSEYLRRRAGEEAAFSRNAFELSAAQRGALREAARAAGGGDFLRKAVTSEARAAFLDASAPSSLDDALKLRALAREFVTASAIEEPAARAEAIRRSLADHPELARWVSEGRDFRALLKDADLELGSQADELVDVERFLKQGTRAQIDSIASAVTLPFLAPLRQTLLRPADDLVGILFGSETPVGRPVARAALRAYADLPASDRLALLRSMGDEPFLNAAGALDRAIERARVSELPVIKQLFEPGAGLDLSQYPEDKAALLRELLGRYFDRMAIADKRGIVQALLELPPGAPLEAKLAAALQNSGPAAQKLFQLMGRDAESPRIQAVMKELLSRVKPIDGEAVRRLVERELGRPVESVFSELKLEPLSTGTVGQAHLARLAGASEWVVVKVLKPGVRERALREIRTLKEIIGSSDFERELVRNIEEGLLRELDLRIEAANLAEGLGYSSRLRGIEVASAVPGVPFTESFMVQRLAQGKVMSELGSPAEMARAATPAMPRAARRRAIDELTMRGDAIERLLARWFERAIFGDGFFHADLHPGNLFYLREAPKGSRPVVTLIDFGSADRLALDQRRGFVQFSIAVAMKSPELSIEALSRFSGVPEAARAAFARDLGILFEKDMGVVERVTQAFRLAAKHDMRIPREVFMFARGDLFLEKQLTEINKALAVLDPKGKAGRYDPMMTYVKVASRHAILESPAKSLRFLPRPIRDRLFDFVGSDSRVSTDIFNGQTMQDIWIAGRGKILEAMGK